LENKKHELIEKIKGIIDTEYSFTICCGYLASLIKNGRIRKQFHSYVEVAKDNLKLLEVYLGRLGVNNFELKEDCKFCKINPESFSLIGAINLGLEIIGVAIGYYKDLLVSVNNADDANLFSRLFKEKITQRNLLNKEKEFNEDKAYSFGTIEQFCIPYIRSRLLG
jgi:hypothetical protein